MDRARSYRRAQLACGLAETALALGYPAALVGAGAGPALHGWASAIVGPGRLQLPLLVAVIGGGLRALTAPLARLSGFWLPRRHGLLHQSPVARPADAAKGGRAGRRPRPGRRLARLRAAAGHAVVVAGRWWLHSHPSIGRRVARLRSGAPAG